MLDNGGIHVHVVADLGFPFIINKGMLRKNSGWLCRLLLQDGSIASKSVQGGCWHAWYLRYKEIFFKNSKFVRVEICRDRSVLHCALRPENTQNESQNDQKFIGTSWFYILFVFLWLQMTLMWTSLLGTLLLAAFHFRLQFSGHEFHCLDAKTASACKIVALSPFERYQIYLWVFLSYFWMK